jgi:hypothetical protein
MSVENLLVHSRVSDHCAQLIWLTAVCVWAIAEINPRMQPSMV